MVNSAPTNPRPSNKTGMTTPYLMTSLLVKAPRTMRNVVGLVDRFGSVDPESGECGDELGGPGSNSGGIPLDFTDADGAKPGTVVDTEEAAWCRQSANRLVYQEVKDRLNEALHGKLHRGVRKGVRNISDTLQQRYEISLVRGNIRYFLSPDSWSFSSVSRRGRRRGAILRRGARGSKLLGQNRRQRSLI